MLGSSGWVQKPGLTKQPALPAAKDGPPLQSEFIDENMPVQCMNAFLLWLPSRRNSREEAGSTHLTSNFLDSGIIFLSVMFQFDEYTLDIKTRIFFFLFWHYILASEPLVLFGTELFGQTTLFLHVQKDIKQLVRNDTFQFFGHKYFSMRKKKFMVRST